MQHTPECQAAQDRYQKAVEEYEQKWPNWCRNCFGMGGFVIRNYPSEPDDYEICSHCMEKGVCPRCGQTVWDVEDVFEFPTTCPKCGWQEDRPQDCHPMPMDGPCECELADAERALEEWQKSMDDEQVDDWVWHEPEED